STGALVFKPDTVKDNALAEFYADAPSDAEERSKRWREFHNAFIGEYVPRLLSPELNGETSADAIINTIGIKVDDKFNEVQSDAQGPADEPLAHAGQGHILRDSIKTKIDQLGLGGRITPDHVLNRAGAMTCGGCHDFSTRQGKDIAGGVPWPASLR